MECFQCRTLYSGEARRPKLLSCGHSFCLPCLRTTDRCFSDGKAFGKPPDELPDDHYTLSNLGMVESELLQVRCETCAAAASDACLDDDLHGHHLVSMQKHCHGELVQRLPQLREAVPVQDPAVGDLRNGSVLKCLSALVADVDLSFVDDDGGDGGGWEATVQLWDADPEDNVAAALRLLLLQMHTDGKLVEQPAEVPTPGPADTPLDALALFGDAGGEADIFGDLDDDSDPGLDAAAGVSNVDDEEVGPEESLDARLYTSLGPESVAQEKSELWASDILSRVRRLTSVRCDKDPWWALQLLERVAPHLEELQLICADRQHLRAVQRMPKLRVLDVATSASGLWDDGFLVPALEHDGGLTHLRLRLPHRTARSLIRAHHRTLQQVLILPLPTPAYNSRREGCSFEDFKLGVQVDYTDRVHYLRNPFFHERKPEDFPVLERIDLPRPQLGRGDFNTADAVRRMFPGVVIEHPTEEADKERACSRTKFGLGFYY